MQGSSRWKTTHSHCSSLLCLIFSEVTDCPEHTQLDVTPSLIGMCQLYEWSIGFDIFSPLIEANQHERERALPKNWWQGSMDTLTPFFNSHSPTDLLFRLDLTQWPPFSIIHTQFLLLSHRMTPFPDNISSTFQFSFQIFSSNMCPNS